MAFSSLPVKATAAKPRANGSGSRIPSPPSALQRARHTPAVPSTVAGRPTSNVTMPSRLPARSVAPVRAPNSAGVPAQVPRTGTLPAPTKPAVVAAKIAMSLPKPTTSPASNTGKKIPAPVKPVSAAAKTPKSLPKPTPPPVSRTGKVPAPVKPVVAATKTSQSSPKPIPTPGPSAGKVMAPVKLAVAKIPRSLPKPTTSGPSAGKVSAPVKPAAARAPTPLPKPKPATIPVAASTGRQTKATSSVRGPPPTSKPTAKLPTSPKPTATKAAVSQPKVVPQPPPKKQPATAIPRVANPVLATASSSLPRPAKVLERPAQNVANEDEDWVVVCTCTPERVKRCRCPPKWVWLAKEQAILKHRYGDHSEMRTLRDPRLRTSLPLSKPQCQRYLETLNCDIGLAKVPDQAMVTFIEDLRTWDKDCGGCCARNTATPKAKKVRFVEPLVTRYRCIPNCLYEPEYFETWRDTTFFWEPSKEELEDFSALAEMF